jgi:hypothetical protein
MPGAPAGAAAGVRSSAFTAAVHARPACCPALGRARPGAAARAVSRHLPIRVTVSPSAPPSALPVPAGPGRNCDRRIPPSTPQPTPAVERQHRHADPEDRLLTTGNSFRSRSLPPSRNVIVKDHFRRPLWICHLLRQNYRSIREETACLARQEIVTSLDPEEACAPSRTSSAASCLGCFRSSSASSRQARTGPRTANLTSPCIGILPAEICKHSRAAPGTHHPIPNLYKKSISSRNTKPVSATRRAFLTSITGDEAVIGRVFRTCLR